MQVLNIFHVLIAIAMVAFILVQRGPGATAGAAFGSGASGTVFGSRGAGSFLSRTTWILTHGGKAYIPSGYMTTWWGKIWKQWPHELAKDDRAILRIGDDLYERRLVRERDEAIVAPLLVQLSEKYAGGAEIPLDAEKSGYLWIFELAPRN